MIKRWKVEVWMEEETKGFEEFELLTLRDLNEAFKKAMKSIEAGWKGFKVVDFDIYEDKEEEEDE